MNKNKLLSRSSRIVLALCVAASMSLSLKAQQGLVIKSSSGSTTPLSYSAVSKLTFVDEIMTIVGPSGVAGQTFSLATTSTITFADVAPNAIDNLSNQKGIKVYPTLAVAQLNIKGASEGSMVSVYNITGSKLMQFSILSDIETVNVSNLKSGVYMLRINGETFKFNKK